ncbi:ABC-F family ATP-binding cassette domain-containing protein [Flavobacterium sp. Fl-318]|uniref:ABC-F family ATP-binding cassette domain-containing protein n=1 Tax=Flavobacterium cupriresistens TaxID=2893885 RepID=A0ABU4RAB0_9FLAO|nr:MULTISPECIES: ABC-F family ATP-binding cassette domain-containing protein [unclassified Flavobacterium]MDX6188589.1 ABC-F family ATP-binding cassette domain-containing protein [Flavobacterium sp. Fl-318]UFH44744.1 ATP-binding cassette domain-containing protein [Flavobacterium sp. F-323]
MLTLQNISYLHTNKDLLFDKISFTANRQDKIALIGNNGSGKSTLLKIISGELQASEGLLKSNLKPYYVPQIFGQFNHLSVAQALQIDDKLNALNEILQGNVTENHLNILGDDWTIEERCAEALQYWQLQNLDLNQKLEHLSGGQKTKIFLAGISIHKPELVLLDEPSNHLDLAGRTLLYNFIQNTSCTLIVVSHDRKLLNLLDMVYELTKRGITVYGGNYDFYAEQKQVESNALNQDIHSKEKALRKAKEKERETLERQQKLDARGKKKQEKAGISRIMMNTLRNNAENSTSKVKNNHAEKVSGISRELQELRSGVAEIDKMKFGFDTTNLHNGKTLFTAIDINYTFKNRYLWNKDLNFQLLSGERIALKGANGSGKTTLIKIITGMLIPQQGSIYRAECKSVYIDQDYSLIDNRLLVYEMAEKFNTSGLQQHDIRMRLNRFLFSQNEFDKPCSVLSGGEKMRLLLCCLTINNQSPNLIILDEPTNNLDIQNIEILTAAINEYQGTLIAISHDDSFLEQINIQKTIDLDHQKTRI